MKYKERMTKDIKKIETEATKATYRRKAEDFTRRRKMPFERVIQNKMNKKGLSGKMVAEFEEMVEMADITSTGVIKQREKIKGEIYNELRKRQTAGDIEQ